MVNRVTRRQILNQPPIAVVSPELAVAEIKRLMMSENPGERLRGCELYLQVVTSKNHMPLLHSGIHPAVREQFRDPHALIPYAISVVQANHLRRRFT